MNSFNNITKIKHERNQKDIVALVEYIIFEDERNNEKYLVFKFQNNVNQYLNEIKFEISQYDEENNLLAKSIISHGGFNAKENEVFVPNYKLKASNDCAKIEAKLLFARYERVVWENGVYTPIPYTVNEFRNDYYRPNPDVHTKSKKLIKAEQKVEYKQFKKLQKQFKKRKNLAVKNIIHRNKTKGPVVFSAILSVFLLIGTCVLTFLSVKNGNVYYDGTFDYQFDGSVVNITDYDGNDKEVIIPLTYTIDDEEYPIVGITDGAFKNTKVTDIILQQNVYIGDSAFENCKSLKSINGDFVTNIGSEAFKNCKSLSKVSFPNVQIVGMNAFEGCTSLTDAMLSNARVCAGAFKYAKNLRKLELLMVDREAQLALIFDDYDNLDSYNLNDVRIGQIQIPSNFAEGLSSLKNVEFTAENPYVDFGALEGTTVEGYYNNGSVEIIDGKIISINDTTKVVIPNCNIDINQAFEFLSKYSHTLQELTIEYQGKDFITGDHLANLYNLNSIRISKNTKVTSDLLLNNNVLTVALSLDSSYNFYIPHTVKVLKIFDTNALEQAKFNTLNNLSNIYNLIIEDTVNYFFGSPLQSFTNLVSLSMPNLFAGSMTDLYRDFGVSRTLVSLKITPKHDTINLSINNFYNLAKIDLEDSNIKTLNLNVKNCSSLNQLLLPKELTSIKSTLIEGTSLTSLVVPSTVTKINYPLIGKNNNALTYVEVPFIGSEENNICSYSLFNESYESTQKLKVTKKITGNVDYMFENCSFKQLIVSIDNISFYTFVNSQISELYIVEASNISADALTVINNLDKLYLPSKKVAKMINYDSFFSLHSTTIYLNGDLPNNAKNYAGYFKTNVKLEDILK